MRKLALAIVLVLVLVGSVVGGVVAANGASPTLSVSGGSSAPSRVSISGKSWTPAVQVNLYMDTTADEAHHVAFATPDSRGSFLASFALGPAELGPHEIIGVQNGTEVHAAFTITNTQQLDDRTMAVLQNIEDIDIDISGEVDKIEAKLDNMVQTEAGCLLLECKGSEEEEEFEYDQIRHVSLTLNVECGDDGDWVKVEIMTPLGWATLDCFGDGLLGIGWIGQNGLHIYQFDTFHWRIILHVGESSKTAGILDCSWAVTTIQEGLPPAP